MKSVETIATMKARCLTVMSTRSQDQELVAETARKYTLSSRDELRTLDKARYVVPAFGWHPWFSHQMRLDHGGNVGNLNHEDIVTAATAQLNHYKSVLTPLPDDEDFLRTLMPPLSFSEYLLETEERLRQFPFALVGEIGLDRGFRLPQGASPMTCETMHTPGSRDGRPLTPYRVNMEHQKKILLAQLKLAAKYGRPVSVHSVQAHGIVFDLLQSLWKDHLRPSKREMKKKRDAEGALEATSDGDPGTRVSEKKTCAIPYPPRICMHSYSGSKDGLRGFLDPKVPAEVFFSFSECINFSNSESSSARATEAIAAVPEDRILMESDLDRAGPVMDKMLEGILTRICKIKKWEIEDGAKILRENWERFIFGP